MNNVSSATASAVSAIDPTASTQLSVATEIARSVALTSALQDATAQSIDKAVRGGDGSPADLLDLHMKTAALRVGVETTSNLIKANKDDLMLLAGKLSGG